ncbi:MAG: M20/M25/M40 family metallo-hydrolase [Clostridia bacterium]|nr:M20/M25/M40 family metallo-hydrolase [Clostridia bacterium]
MGPLDFVFVALVALLVLLIAVVLIRTAAFRPKESIHADGEPVEFDRDATIERLRALVRCRTVSYHDKSLESEAEFEKLIDSLPTLYPHVFEVCTLTRMDDRALLFHWKGKGDGQPAVFMAHYDVVPVDEAKWKKPPFEAILEDGVIWGRGTLDTKATFNGVLSAADHLIERGFTPEADVYFAFSGGEEINGKGAVHIVDYFEKSGITPAMVVDEGGAVVENVFPGVKKPCALIGIAEKGMMDVSYTVKTNGGHASAPKPHTPVGLLSAACCRMENDPFPAHLTPPVAKMFDTLGRHSTFVYRMVFSNLWLFSGVLDLICRKSGGDLNAMMRTTVAFTQMQGSPAPNVLPTEASMVSNMRLNPADTVEGALSRIRCTVKDERVEVGLLQGTNPSRISTTDCPAWNKITSSVAATWGDVIVSPYLMVQCSDSRHWGRISDRVYRFSAMDLTGEERATIHGNNERIRVDCACRTVEFYIRLMGKC